MSKYYFNREQYAVYEKKPAHGGKQNSIVLGPYNTKEEAEQAMERYGYNNENYYVDKIQVYAK